LLAWGGGQVFRDRSWVTGLCFYIPAPALAALLLATAGWALVRRRWTRATVFVLMAVAPVFFTAVVENQWVRADPSEAPSASSRLVHWNVFRGRLGWGAVAARLREEKADVYVISEMAEDIGAAKAAADVGSEYQGRIFSGLAVFTRGGLAAERRLLRAPGIKVHEIRWRDGDTDLKVFVADLSPGLLNWRDPRLRRLVGLMRSERPDLVVGDFNAPRRSRALCPLPDRYVHAYEAAGAGWSYTWPVPCPVLAIDQCIVGPRVVALRYELESTAYSDHRLQVLDFAVRRRGDN